MYVQLIVQNITQQQSEIQKSRFNLLYLWEHFIYDSYKRQIPTQQMFNQLLIESLLMSVFNFLNIFF